MTGRRNRPTWQTWQTWSALAIIVVLAISSTIGLHSITDDWSFLLPAALGSICAAAAFVIARRWSLLPGETLVIALGLFVVGGVLTVSVVAAGTAPSPGSIGDFFDGLIRSWADLLSAVTPADLTPRLSVAPFAAAWFATVLGCSLWRWSPLPAAPVLGPLVGLSLIVLLTDEDRVLSVIVGAAIAVGALLLGYVLDPRRRADSGAGITDHTMETTTSVSPHARVVRVGLMLAAVAIIAPLLGPRLPLADAHERYDLRDQVVPPWDPLSLPSPLVELKAELAGEHEDDVVFDVTLDDGQGTGAPGPTRWSTAVMTSYDGVVWTVADPHDAATDFRPVGPRLPDPDAQPTSDPTVTATVTIESLDAPWLPVPGAATRLSFDRQGGPTPTLVENPESNTLAVTSGVTPGLSYDVTAYRNPEPSDDELRRHPIDSVPATVDLEALPPQIRNLAADITEGIDHGWGQIEAIRDRFRDQGFYDKSVLVPPGHSYYRLAQFLADPDQIVGYEEQYAAAAGLIARIAGLPVRVVAGYEIEPDRYVNGAAEVRSGDASAWIEVRVDGVGWVPVPVSPPRSREPATENAVASQDQVATPNPPPPPQVPPDVDVFTDNQDVEEPVDEPDDEPEEPAEPAAATGIGVAGWMAIGGGSLVLLLLCAGGTIVLWKRHRTVRRRNAGDPASRIAGAWLELTDRFTEAGVDTPANATPLEAVRAMARNEPAAASTETELIGLARQVDRAAYDRVGPPQTSADDAWRYSDDAVDALLARRSLPRRTRMRVDPRPLLRRDPATRSGRTGTDSDRLTVVDDAPEESAGHPTPSGTLS